MERDKPEVAATPEQIKRLREIAHATATVLTSVVIATADKIIKEHDEHPWYIPSDRDCNTIINMYKKLGGK